MSTKIPHTAIEAKKLGWEVDSHCYPWVAYLGSRFNPDGWVHIDTPPFTARRPPRRLCKLEHHRGIPCPNKDEECTW